MAYCRKVPFQNMAIGCTRIDIVFDLYLEQSIKHGKRKRRPKNDAIEVKISNAMQLLPIDMDKFWPSSSNKIQLQQIFIIWVQEYYHGDIPVYLGGANREDITSCTQVSGGQTDKPHLKCFHEEADDRLR